MEDRDSISSFQQKREVLAKSSIKKSFIERTYQPPQEQPKLQKYNDPTEVLFNPVGYFQKVLEKQASVFSDDYADSQYGSNLRPQSSNVYQQKALFKAQGNGLLQKAASQNRFDGRPITQQRDPNQGAYS